MKTIKNRQLLEVLLSMNDAELDQPGVLCVELPAAAPGQPTETVFAPLQELAQLQEALIETEAGLVPASQLTAEEAAHPATRLAFPAGLLLFTYSLPQTDG